MTGLRRNPHLVQHTRSVSLEPEKNNGRRLGLNRLARLKIIRDSLVIALQYGRITGVDMISVRELDELVDEIEPKHRWWKPKEGAMMKLLLAILFLAWASVAQAQLCANLSWIDNSASPNGEDGFQMERQLNGGPWTVIAAAIGANITTYSDCTLVQGATPNIYTYRVAAFNAAGSSAYSNTASKTIAALPPVIPNAPTGLTVSAISNQTLEASWANDTPAASTELTRRTANDPAFISVATVAPGKSVYRQMGLPSRTTYCYKARAVMNGQTSDFTDLACATTK